MWIAQVLFSPVFLLCTADAALYLFPSSLGTESLPSREEGEQSSLGTNGVRLGSGAGGSGGPRWGAGPVRAGGCRGLSVDAAEAALRGFSRGLAVAGSAFLLVTGNKNAGTRADLSQAFPLWWKP